MSNTLKNFRSSGKSNSHYTIYFYNYNLSEVIKLLSDKLEKINKSIKDSYKKKMANDIIYEIITTLENGSYNGRFNYFILANQNNCNIIPFSKNDIQLANTWNMTTSMMEYDNKFMINYLEKLFSTELNLLVYHFNNKKVTIKYVDYHKVKVEKVVSVDKFDDIAKLNSSTFSIYCGLSSYLDKNKPTNLIKGKSVSNDDIIEYYQQIIEDKNIARLEKDILGNICNEKVNHKLLFGRNEISEGITNMVIKTLYITKKLYKVLRKKLEDTNSKSLLNFEIITITNGNVLKKFEGMIAEKYY
tara:strand:- start:4237 stop:5139 length:903 start_codon:yes stop_codon:yes gene_type:complete